MSEQYETLKSVPLFSELPEADLRRLCEEAEDVRVAAGEQLFAEGSPGDRAYVITEGTLEVVKASGPREVLLNVLGVGDVVGEMALLEGNPRMASVNARTDATLVAITKEQLDGLLSTSLPATRALFYTVLGRWRSTEGMLRQGEKMAQLGTLTAGVAHELNNPAAAVKRGADQVGEAIERCAAAERQLAGAGLPASVAERIEGETARAREAAGRPPDIDALTRSDRESEVETWLEGLGASDGWELAPALVDLGHDPASLAELTRDADPAGAAAAARRVATTYAMHTLIAEIGQGAGRISDIVKALKSYAYLDQGPVQDVDLHEGIDNTLLILRAKLKGIEVRREYFSDLPKIEAYGSELNQVWTNLIDNAADALDGRGTITLRTRTEGEWAVVDVEDDGPGIPPEIQSRVFDAFFTTKPPGKGTGMGLDITYNIVVYKHRGDIKLTSEPGMTRFTVWLPLNG
ncbi:MAG: cyclic nucleotide-binding domain-containing protein [Chloroflexi bacterium]|nr:cyclic nucleotide-binding domain-containing protein [Chloroflexota bacterium]